jgi:uncharacterized membrane protein
MNKNRLEAFSDGVLAIIITIMVLEIKIPHGSDWFVLKPLIPIFISYGLSFAYIGIYWGNHHHMLQSVRQVTSKMILANLNLLFWLSMVPFATGWMGENEFKSNPMALYGIVLFLSGASYSILQKSVERNTHDIESLKLAYKFMNQKGNISTIAYLASIPLAYVEPYISFSIYIIVAIMWLVPDRNIEKALKAKD